MTKPELEAIQTELQSKPAGFIELILGLPLYDWQSKTVNALWRAMGPKGRVTQISCVAPNESGKSSRIVAGGAIYWAAVHPKGKVVITTKDSKQLNEQILPAIEACLEKCPDWKIVRSPYFKAASPTKGKIVAYTTDEAGRAEGFHSDGPDAPLLIIVDEAKSVAETIFDAIDRCGFKALMYVSSGGTTSGTFFESQTDLSDQFICVRAGLKDCPHISQEKIDRIIRKHGENDPFTRSTIYGEFMQQLDAHEYIFPLAPLDACVKNPPKHRPGLKLGFCDFAEGQAEHVFVMRDGNKAWVEKAWREADKHAAASKFVYEFRKSGLKEDQIAGDAADAEMLRLLRDLGWTIHGQNFGHKAQDDEAYASWTAEAWHETAAMVLRQEIIVPDDDPVLFKQLQTRKKTIVGRGKKGVEEKYVMKRDRNLPSPDRADAYCGVFNMASMVNVYDDTKQPFTVTGWREELEREGSEKFLESIGAWAGV